MLNSLERGELDNELDQNLERNDKFHEILVKIDSCLYSPKQPEREFFNSLFKQYIKRSRN